MGHLQWRVCYCTEAGVGELIYSTLPCSLARPNFNFTPFLQIVLFLSSMVMQNMGLRFMWYYEYKRIVTDDGARNLTTVEAFVGGMTAGIFSTLGNHPFDVLKTRLQGIHADEQYYSTWDCVWQTFRTEGIPGFYKGLVPRLMRVVPGQGIIFMSFESIVNILVAIFGT
jgi:hypothetical protein